MKKEKVWLVTGASKGFGFEITKAILGSGDRVIATVRKDPEKLKQLYLKEGKKQKLHSVIPCK